MQERKSTLFRFGRKSKNKESKRNDEEQGEKNEREKKSDGSKRNGPGSKVGRKNRQRRSEMKRDMRGSSFNSMASYRSHVSNTSSTHFNSSFLSDINFEESFSENQIQKREFTFLSSQNRSSSLAPSRASNMGENQGNDGNSLSFGLKLHPKGYPLAMPKLCKLISSTKNSIVQAGGCPLKKEGFVTLSVPQKSKNTRSRLLALENGKLKIYKVDEKHGDLQAIPGVRKKELTLVLQRIFDIKYLSFEATEFSLIFEKRRKKKKGVMEIIRSKSMSSQKRSSLRKMRGKQTMREQATTPRRPPETPRRPPDSPRRRARNRNTAETQQSGTGMSQRSMKRTGTLRFKLSRSKTARSSGSLMMSPGSQGRMRGSFDQSRLGTPLSQMRPGTKKDNLLVGEDKDKENDHEEVIFMFDSKEECQNWLAAIVLEIENQAKLFLSCINLLEEKKEEDNYEIILRKAVDLMTLAKGVRNREVWQMRELLAETLEKKDKAEDAKMWYNLSAQNREEFSILDLIENAKLKKKVGADTHQRDETTATDKKKGRASRANSRNGRRTVYSFGSMLSIRVDNKENRRIMPPATKATAIENLTIFIEQHSRGNLVIKAKDEAIKMVRDNSFVEIARRCEAEYGEVPEGFEFYLIVAGKSPLEKIRDLSEALKMQDRNRRRQ